MERLKIMIGQHFVCGFAGTTLSEEFRRLIKEYKIGNVVLFRHNVENKEQLARLCEEIQELVKKETGYPAFITIDQEGGVVTRLSEEFCNVPEGMALSAAGNMEYVKTCAKITARQLRSCGVNFNLAPVLDINNNPQNPVIGVRSYGDTPQAVIEASEAAIAGYAEENLLCCGKHFPGHGNTEVDSHLGLPVIDKTLEELKQFELLPFQCAIRDGIPAIMTGHILFPEIEKEKIPATMSRTIITDVLKKELGFQGLIMSDCMEMNAIKKYYGSAQGTVGALRAGVDLICISHSTETAEECTQEVYQALERGELSRKELEESTAKILSYKERYKMESKCSVYDDTADKMLEREIRKKTIVHACGRDYNLGTSPIFIGCDNYCVTQVSNPQEDRSVVKYLAERFAGKGIVTGIDPTEQEIAQVAEQIKEHDSIVLCTYNMHLMPGQRRMLEMLSKVHVPMLVVAMRNPYDLRNLPKHVTGIAAWDYSAETLELLAELLAGEWKPTGHMPVCLDE